MSAAAAVVSALAVVRGRPGTALCGLVALAALNAELYELLLRRQGPAAATAGVGLHAVHHVTGALAVPVGVARHLNGSAAPSGHHAHEDTARARRT